jgi:hypothetical protein
MMKRVAFAALLFFCASASAQDKCVAPKQSDIKSDTNIPLCLVAAKVAATLDQYNSDPKTIADALPHLLSADFGFKTVGDDTVGFKVSILVFSFGTSRKAEATNEVTFTYTVPPPKKSKGENSEISISSSDKKPKPVPFEPKLIETLQQAAEQIKSTQSVGDAKFTTLTVTLAYGVTWDFNGGVTLPIQLWTLGGTVDHSRSDTQTIKLTFKNQVPTSIKNQEPTPTPH